MTQLLLVLASATVLAVSGSPVGKREQAEPALQHALATKTLGNRSSSALSSDLFCSPCITFGAEGLQELTELVTKSGVSAACDDVCSQLPSPVLAKFCDTLCEKIGVEALADLLQQVDLDIFYFCDLVYACTPGPDDASILLGDAVASPASVSEGGSVQLSVPLIVRKPSGPGQYVVQVRTPAISPLNGTSTFTLPAGILAGTPALVMKLPLRDSSGKSRTLGRLPTGTWTFEIEVCQGECGSLHPHSKSFGKAKGKFEVTGEAMSEHLVGAMVAEVIV